MTSPTINDDPTRLTSPLKKLGNNVSDHTTMTTPLHDESDTSHTVTPTVITKPKKPDGRSNDASQEVNSAALTTTTTSKADIVLGDFVAEGGFCTIYELAAIKNLDNGEWIMQPIPTSPSKQSHHHNRGNSAFGSLGNLAGIPSRRLGPSGNHHKRGMSSGNLMRENIGSLPPLMKSAKLTVVHPFLSPNATTAMTMSSSGSSPKKPFRRSGSRDVVQEAARQASPYVMKCLKPAVFGTPKVLAMGLKDMEIEIDMLQKLQHPHIVSLLAHGTMVLEAVPISPKKQAGTPPPPTAYPFVILDRLGETLEDKLVFWETKHHKHSSLVGKLVTHRRHKKENFCAHERWHVLKDMASALDYMHQQRYVYFWNVFGMGKSTR